MVVYTRLARLTHTTGSIRAFRHRVCRRVCLIQNIFNNLKYTNSILDVAIRNIDDRAYYHVVNLSIMNISRSSILRTFQSILTQKLNTNRNISRRMWHMRKIVIWWSIVIDLSSRITAFSFTTKIRTIINANYLYQNTKQQKVMPEGNWRAPIYVENDLLNINQNTFTKIIIPGFEFYLYSNYSVL